MKVHFYKTSYELNEEDFCRRVHIDGDGAGDQNARRILPGLFSVIRRNMELKTCWLSGNREFQTGFYRADRCEKQLICLIYSDKKFGGMINHFFESGNHLNAWLLNALADEQIFQASEQLMAVLSQTYAKEEKQLTQPFFPGDDDGTWACQKSCLEILKKEADVPVSTTDGYMLDPEKSLLFVLGADSVKAEEKAENLYGQENLYKNSCEYSWEHDCKNCPRTDCSYRR